jgi:hypothetical protein
MATASASTAMRHVISLRRLAGKIFLNSENYLERTKYALNNWLRVNGPLFDTSTALEILGFTGAEAREGLAAHLEKRKPVFPQDCPL